MGTHYKGLRFDWSRTDCDIWMFNEAPNVKIDGKLMYPRTDALFQLHHEAIWKNPKNRSDEKHYQWLSSGKTPPVYMQEKYAEVPESIKYPLEEVLSLVENVQIVIDGKEKIFKYFSSSPEFALALAASMWKKGRGYEIIEIWGIELAHESEYVYQRTGFAFWTGYLAALGIKLVLHNSIFDAPMYGYEADIAITSEFLERRIADLTKELGDKKEIYNQEAKTFLKNLSELLRGDISKSIESGLNELTKRNEKTGILNGQIRECQQYLEKARAMETASNSSVFSMGEFDSMRYLYNAEYAKARNSTANVNAQIGIHLKRLLNLKKGSQKRQRAIDELGRLIAEMMNKNMTLLHLVGAMQENQYFIDSAKLSIKAAGGKT